MKKNPILFLFMLCLTMGIPIGFVVAVNWWLETRFGAQIAILTWGGALAIVCLLIGAIIVILTQRITLMGAADIMHDHAQSSKQMFGVMKEQAKLERDVFNKRAQLDTIDYREVQKLAAQRAKLIAKIDNESQGAAVPTWNDDDDDWEEVNTDNDGFQWVE